MKKKYIIGAIATTLLFSLTGCTDKKEDLAKKVEDSYNSFMIYNKEDDKNTKFEFDLKNTDEKITTSEQARLLNAKEFNGEKTDRQEFLDYWEELDKDKRKESKFKEIQENYKKTVAILVASESVLTYYEDVRDNAKAILNSKEEIKKKYDKSNYELGGRGKAYNDYVNATAYGETEDNSARMKYIKQKYKDTVNFLEAANLAIDGDLKGAKQEMNKIEDKDLKSNLQVILNK